MYGVECFIQMKFKIVFLTKTISLINIKSNIFQFLPKIWFLFLYSSMNEWNYK